MYNDKVAKSQERGIHIYCVNSFIKIIIVLVTFY